MSHILVLVVCVLPPFNLAMSEHKVVLVGDSIVLIGTERTTSWHFHPLSYTGYNDKDRDLYLGGEELLHGLDEEGFQITVNKTVWEVNLIIANATVDKAGKYQCRKDHKNFIDYKLIVLEKVPVCRMTPLSADRIAQCAGRKTQVECNGSCISPQNGETLRRASNEFIGPNICDIPQDQILVSCSVTYYGNNATFLELRNLRNNKIIETSCSTTELNATIYRNQLSCNANMNATMDLDGTQFIWQTKQLAQTQYNCTTQPIKILYSIDGAPSKHQTVQLHDKLICTANCSNPCSYKWTQFEKSGQGVNKYEECTKELTAYRPGSYICEARCQIGNYVCKVVAMDFDVLFSAVSQQEELSKMRPTLVSRNVEGKAMQGSQQVGDQANAGSKTSVSIVVVIFTMGRLLDLWHKLI